MKSHKYHKETCIEWKKFLEDSIALRQRLKKFKTALYNLGALAFDTKLKSAQEQINMFTTLDNASNDFLDSVENVKKMAPRMKSGRAGNWFPNSHLNAKGDILVRYQATDADIFKQSLARDQLTPIFARMDSDAAIKAFLEQRIQ